MHHREAKGTEAGSGLSVNFALLRLIWITNLNAKSQSRKDVTDSIRKRGGQDVGLSRFPLAQPILPLAASPRDLRSTRIEIHSDPSNGRSKLNKAGNGDHCAPLTMKYSFRSRFAFSVI